MTEIMLEDRIKDLREDVTRLILENKPYTEALENYRKAVDASFSYRKPAA